MIGSARKFAALRGWLTAILIAVCAVSALAQQDTNQPGNRILEFPNLGPIPGGMEPSLGPGPGALEADNLSAPAGSVIGGRRRSGRIPRSGRNASAGMRSAATSARGMQVPETLPAPNPGRQLAISTTVFDRTLADDAGPADGLSLDDKRQRIPGSQLPDLVENWRTRDPKEPGDRKANHFFVPAQEIREKSYDLSFNRYSTVEHDEAVYEEPKVILQKLKALEDKIQSGIAELEEILG